MNSNIKKFLIPVAGIVILGVYYVISSGNSAGSTQQEKKSILNMPTASSNALKSAEKLSKSEAYELELEERKRKEAEWQRIRAQSPTSVADNMNSVIGEKDSRKKYFYVQNKYGEVEKVEEEDLTEEMKENIVESPTPAYTATPVKEKVVQYETTKPKYTKSTTPSTAPKAAEPEEKRRRPVRFNSSTYASSNAATDFTGHGDQMKESSYIPAEVYGEHKIGNGEALRFRTTKEAVVNGVTIPRNTIFSAKGSGSGKRLKVSVPNITVSGQRVTTNMRVYDLDNLEGISVPFDFGRDAVNEGAADVATDAIDEVAGYTSTGRVASSAIRAISNTARGAARQDKVYIPDGYEVTFKVGK